jgi:Opacity family porin protein
MVRIIVATFILIPTLLIAQEDNSRIIKKGLFRAQGTIGFGTLKSGESTIYIHGNTEYYLSELISTRGDLYYYLPSNDENSLNLNHQLFFGASYHFKTTSNFNPYIGFQPGLALSQSNVPAAFNSQFAENKTTTSNATANPLVSSVIGFNYYATGWFHLFADVRYVYGNHLSSSPRVSLNEFRASFGLGFNFNILFE